MHTIELKPYTDCPAVYALSPKVYGTFNRRYASTRSLPSGGGFTVQYGGHHKTFYYNNSLNLTQNIGARCPKPQHTFGRWQPLTEEELIRRGVRDGWSIRLVLGGDGLLGFLDLVTIGIGPFDSGTEPVCIAVQGLSWWAALPCGARLAWPSAVSCVHPSVPSARVHEWGDRHLRVFNDETLRLFVAHTTRLGRALPTLKPMLARWNEAWEKATMLFKFSVYGRSDIENAVYDTIAATLSRTSAYRLRSMRANHPLKQGLLRLIDGCTHDPSILPFIAQAFTSTLPAVEVTSVQIATSPPSILPVYPAEAIVQALGTKLHAAKCAIAK